MQRKKHVKSTIYPLLAMSTVVGVFVLGTGSARATEIISGGVCKAANLAQAGNLIWNQWGVNNPQPVGGRSFFVLCPLGPKDDDKATFANMQFEVGTEYLDAQADPAVNPVAPVMTCTIREIKSDVTPTVINVGVTFNVSPTFTRATLTGSTVDPYANWMVVCALHPQQRLTYISIEY